MDSFGTYFFPIISSFILLLGIVATRDRPLFFRFILYVQIFYIFLGLICRPILIAFVKPNRQYGDSIAQSANIPESTSIENTLSTLNLIVLLGIGVYIVSVVYFSRLLQLKSTLDQHEVRFSLRIQNLLPALFVCTLAQMIIFFGVGFAPLAWLAKSIFVLLSLAFIFTNLSIQPRNIFIAFISALLVYGFILSVIQNSKTPISAAFLIGLISYSKRSMSASFPQAISSKAGFRKFFIYVPGGISLIYVFSFIQQGKFDEKTQLVNSTLSEKYFPFFPEFYDFFLRFDLFRSISEAKITGVGGWLNIQQYLELLFSSLAWNYDTEGQTIAQLWAQNVASLTNSAHYYSGVSLSQSFIAEGWLLAGYPGIIVIAIVFSLLTCLVAKSLYKSFPLAIVGLYMVFSNSLYEGSFLANIESFSQGVKTAIIVMLLVIPFRSLDSMRSNSGNRKSSL